MIFLFILYHLFLHGNVLAGPLPPSQSTSEKPFYPREIDSNRFTQRSEWNIVWSCFATIFACSWVAIHPNIPAQSDSSRRIFFRRLMIMAYMLIAPEYVILWAGRQWYAARDIMDKHKDRGWTSMTHGYFASMGGFTLYEDGVMTETLVIERLEELESKGRIHWPSISQKEIEDRSKGDVFSKGFAILQTTWFIIHCIARGAYGLIITELEVATLAFAALNGILYFLWWNKPLWVVCPVPVYLISSKEEAGTQTTVSECGATPDNALPPINSSTMSSHTANVALESANEISQKVDSLLESTPLEEQHSSAFVRYCVKFKDILLVIFFCIHSHMYDMIECTAINHGSSTLSQSVPTFYAPSCGTSRTTIRHRSAFIGSIIGILFGGIHCIAWSWSFPSVEEKYVWRASAVTIIVIPSFFLVSGFVDIAYKWSKSDSWNSLVDQTIDCLGYLIIIVPAPYLVSRAVLLILPLIALRSLPAGSLLDIKWSSFIPHI